jgi:hypothetical protein
MTLPFSLGQKDFKVSNALVNLIIFHDKALFLFLFFSLKVM